MELALLADCCERFGDFFEGFEGVTIHLGEISLCHWPQVARVSEPPRLALPLTPQPKSIRGHASRQDVSTPVVLARDVHFDVE